ncbi:MAG: UDP-N-acetylmuramate--L-alanine ligase [Desulfomonilaceae bacterium]
MTGQASGSGRLPFTSLKELRRVHLMGIGGTGMSGLAGMFHSFGVEATGSDEAVYPPTSLLLNALNIHPKIGYTAENLSPRPDLVVVGNVVRRDNPEAVEMEKLRLAYASLPECLNRFFLADKQLIVVAGTHGKTTVSSMIAWILIRAGMDPTFLIGGIHGNVGANYRIGKGQFFVLEGDEYDTAYFDKRPKILHYHPYIGVLTSCEFDHADIYRDVRQIEEQFRKFVGQISPSGTLVACADYQNVMEISRSFSGRVAGYGSAKNCTWTMTHARHSGRGMELAVVKDGAVIAEGAVPFTGSHNARNALAALIAADAAGVPPHASLEALSTYKMTARRQQILLETPSVTIIDDFAHHPTAVRETVKAVRNYHRPKRLIAVFEPRSNSSRTAIFQEAYAHSFSDADMVLIKEPAFRATDPLNNRFDAQRLASDLRDRGLYASSFRTSDSLFDFLVNHLKPKDVILIMTNGHFDNLASRLVQVLQEEDVERSAALRKN